MPVLLAQTRRILFEKEASTRFVEASHPVRIDIIA
jgi:hypothetical protein